MRLPVLQRRYRWLLVVLSIEIVKCLNNAAPMLSSTMKDQASMAQRLLDRVRKNNRAADTASVPFLVGNQHLGSVLPQAVQAFSKYPSVFSITEKGLQLIDHSDWGCTTTTDSNLVDQRSQAVHDVLLDLRHQNHIPALQGWRDERFAVRATFHAPPALFVERAAAVLFGVPAYGVFLNGYTVEQESCGQPVFLIFPHMSGLDVGPLPRPRGLDV
jgi:Domain of unknown function (DUF4743)